MHRPNAQNLEKRRDTFKKFFKDYRFYNSFFDEQLVAMMKLVAIMKLVAMMKLTFFILMIHFASSLMR